jgi:hypothetical protein
MSQSAIDPAAARTGLGQQVEGFQVALDSPQPAQLLEIELAAKLDGATRLRVAAGIDRLIDGVD